MNLTHDAMLVSLRINSWSGRLYDRQASQQVAIHHDADTNAGRYNKRLLPKQAFAALAATMSNARTSHNANTLPWDDQGGRLLTVANYERYTTALDTLIERVVRERARFIEDYDDFVDQARLDLGRLFRLEDYPGTEALHGKFAIRYRIVPVPDPLHLNEIAAVRAGLLSGLFEHTPVTRHNAESIGDYLPGLHPTVVLMNPPFSASPGVQRIRHEADLRHLRSAFSMLPAGGRLVAITSAGCIPGDAAWSRAFERLDPPPRTVFSIAIDGRAYARRGTTFDTRLTVIDRDPANAQDVPIDARAVRLRLPAQHQARADREPARARLPGPRRERDLARPARRRENALGDQPRDRGGRGRPARLLRHARGADRVPRVPDGRPARRRRRSCCSRPVRRRSWQASHHPGNDAPDVGLLAIEGGEGTGG